MRTYKGKRSAERREDIVFLMEHNVGLEEIITRLELSKEQVQRHMRYLKKESDEGFKLFARWLIMTGQEEVNSSTIRDVERYREMLRKRE